MKFIIPIGKLILFIYGNKEIISRSGKEKEVEMENTENKTNTKAISLDSLFKDIPIIDKDRCGKLPEIEFPPELATVEEFIASQLDKRRV